MPPVVYAFLSLLGVLFRSQLHLRAENIALRHQLAIYQRYCQATDHSARRPHPLVLVVALLGKVAGRAGLRAARDRNRLAAETFSR
jgi:hypothetical protein